MDNATEAKRKAREIANLLFPDRKHLPRNPHGSIVMVPFRVISLDRTRAVDLNGMADTGSMYSLIPGWVITELGLAYVGQVHTTLMDDRTVLSQCFVGIAEIEGQEGGSFFLQQPGTMTVIGALTLEGLGFKVNSWAGRLERITIPM